MTRRRIHKPRLGIDPRPRRATVPGALVLLALACVAGCGHGGVSRWDLHADVQRPRPGVVLLLVDGLPPRLVAEGCRNGRLPNIQKRLWDGGARVTHATTCLPSITYAAITTLLTGVGPAEHGIIGNRWFDPDAALFRNYATIEHYRDVNHDFDPPTLYELIAPRTSVSIQAAHRRGVTENVANWAVSGTMWFFGDFTAVDKLTASSLGRVTRWANGVGRWPDVLTCYFPGLDSIGHRFGVSSAKFARALRHSDHQVGRICDWLERQGLLETTYIVLVSDHGMVDVEPDGFIDLVSLVRDVWGRQVTTRMLQDGSTAARRAFYDRYDTVVDHRDGRRAALHFRGDTGWSEPPTPRAVAAILTSVSPENQLWNVPGIALVAYLAAANEALLGSQRGVSRILSRPGPDGPVYAYQPETADVLGYTVDPDLANFVVAGFHDSRGWLRATADQTLPDVVPHVIPLLHVRRAGQVVLFAEPGYSFVPEKGGHGGLHRDERLMTFMIAGPGIAPGAAVDTARAVDLVPTLLDLMNVEPDENLCLEGSSLLNAGRLSTRLEALAGG